MRTNNASHPVARLRLLGGAFLGAATLTVGACNLVAPVAMLVEGPPKTQAAYEMDPQRPTVIFVDDRGSHLPRRSLRMTISEAAEQALMKQGAIEQENMISSRAASEAAEREKFGAPMSITDIGKAVGAEVVVYVVIDSWTLSRDGVSFSPDVSARVKVIDVVADARAWPLGESKGHILHGQFPRRTGLAPDTGAMRSAAQSEIASVMGGQIARLFYDHLKAKLSGKLDD